MRSHPGRRRIDELPPTALDRYEVLQILIVLLGNARDAVLANEPADRRIMVDARRGVTGELAITIEDNGCGITPQHLEQVFSLGFTTKPDRHGMGLHFSACTARELRGTLTARSAGVGQGAAFVLTLPLPVPAGPAEPGESLTTGDRASRRAG